MFSATFLAALLLGACCHQLAAESAADRGYYFLTEKAFVPPDFDDQAFDEVWKVWPEPLRSKAANVRFGARHADDCRHRQPEYR